MYSNGRGVPEDDTEAVRWFRLAADQGGALAQFRLGVRYANGEGVPEDDTEAVRWYRLAADQGNARAQYNLGVMYSTGTAPAGVSRRTTPKRSGGIASRPTRATLMRSPASGSCTATAGGMSL